MHNPQRLQFRLHYHLQEIIVYRTEVKGSKSAIVVGVQVIENTKEGGEEYASIRRYRSTGSWSNDRARYGLLWQLTTEPGFNQLQVFEMCTDSDTGVRGRGWRHRFYATGVPGWVSPTPEQEIADLNTWADQLKTQLDAILKRIEELKS